MAKGDITLKYSVQDAGVADAMNKFAASMQGAGDKSRKLADDVGRADAALSKAQGNAEGWASKMLSVSSAANIATTAINLVSRAVTEFNEIQAKKAEGFKERNTSLADTLGSLGILGRFGHANELMGSIQTNAYDAKGKEAVLSGLYKKLGAGISEKEMDNVYRATIQAGGIGVKDTTTFGATYAQLRKAGAMKGSGWENMSDTDYKNLALSTMGKMPGGFEAADLKLLYESKDKNMGLATLTALKAASEGDKRGMHLLDLVNHTPTSEESRKWKGSDRSLSEAELAAKRIFNSGATPEDRLRQLALHPEMAGEADRGLARNFSERFNANYVSDELRNGAYGTQARLERDMVNTNADYRSIKANRAAEIKGNQISEGGGRKPLDKQTRVQNDMNEFQEKFGEFPVPGLRTGFEMVESPLGQKIVKLLEDLLGEQKRSADANERQAENANGGPALRGKAE